jgi:hypothetical protein
MSVSSNLQTQPAWLDTFPDADVLFGFDATGMWFSGNAGAAPYPIRTNYDIDGETTVVVIYTFVHADVDEGCPDQGICFFKADVEPYWSWGDNTSRIAVQYNCGDPEINGQENTVESDYALTVGDTYTARVTYNPVAETITHELFDGASVTDPLVDTLVLENERLPAGAYRIGFHADLDTDVVGGEKSYFTYLEISAEPIEIFTRVFRALHFPHRRREVVSELDPTPINVQPGEMLYDAEENKLYAGLDDESTIEVSGGGGGSGDYLPLSGGTMTGNIVFDGTGGQFIGKGLVDTERGGNYGISLVCAIGYQLNWQSGWLLATEQDLSTPRPVYLDSAAGTTLRVWNADEAEGVEISHTGITFGDSTTQDSAGVTSKITGITGAAAITNIVSISQAAYDALATKNATTLYIING